jgi:outer membrane lipoprotein SlyB
MRKSIALLAAAIGMTLIGCQSSEVLPADEANAFAAEIDGMVDNTLEGLSEGDYEKHVQGFDDELRDEIDPVVAFPQVYDEIMTTFGRYESRELVRVEDNGRFRTVVYRATFSKDPSVTVRVVFWRSDPEHRISALTIEPD